MESKVISVEALGLPSAKKEKSSLWVDQKFLMYGATKVGKTKFWGQGEGNLFLATERGHNHIDSMRVDIDSHKQLMDTLDKLVQARKIEPYPYKAVIIDTFDREIEYIEEDVIEWGRNKYKNAEIYSIGDIPNGAGWAERTARVTMVLRRLEELPCAVAVIMHMTVDELEDDRGKFKKQTVNIGGKSNKAITGWADHTMAVSSVYVGDQLLRKVKLRPTRTLDAGSRGILPDFLDWGPNDAENWKKFRSFFS